MPIPKLKIKFTQRQIITFFLAVSLLILNSTMRHGVWKRTQHFNLDKTRYEKLALAYHLGGDAGIDYTLGIFAKYDKASGDFIQKVSKEIKETKDVQQYIRSSMAADRAELARIKKNRAILSYIIYLIIAVQVFVNSRYWWKDNKHLFVKTS